MSEQSGPGRDEQKKDPFDGEYIGNIWGWRFSLIGLALLMLLLSLMIYRHYTLGVPFGGERLPRQEKRETPVDSVGEDSLSEATLAPSRESGLCRTEAGKSSVVE